MEYVYAALLLHKLQQKITEENVKKIVQAAGVKPEDVKVKALVAALSEVNIDEALKTAPVTPVASVAAPTAAPEAKPAAAEEKVEEKKEEALEGLSSLFG